MIPALRSFPLEDFHKALHDWYRLCARPLPWRRTTDPYAIWVSEVMLQQTRVDTVLSYYNRFLEWFPDVQTLADASETRVLKAWEGLGYYGRARNLHRAAKILCERVGGAVPENETVLRSLPGIGDYIAAAVLSFAFGKPCAVLDGNVKRVLARLFAIDHAVDDSAATSIFQQTAQALFPPEHGDMHNQAMMELGALLCIPHRPRCAKCPVDRYCLSSRNGWTDHYPVRKERRTIPVRRIAVVVPIRSDGCMMVVKRPSHGLLGGLWEFPNVEIDGSPCIEEVVQRFSAEMIGISRLFGSRSIGRVHHAYTHFKVQAEVFRVDVGTDLPDRNQTESSLWVHRNRLEHYPLSKLTYKILRLMEKEKR